VKIMKKIFERVRRASAEIAPPRAGPKRNEIAFAAALEVLG
jgi:hypothetical protein